MKRIQILVLTGLLTLLSGASYLRARESGRTQHLTSSDQVPDSLSARAWSSIRQQYEQHRHAAVPVASGHQARNPGQQWQTRFDGRGFLVLPDLPLSASPLAASSSWTWGLELRSYGFPGHERVVAPGSKSARVSAAGQRVTYDWDDTLQEWFVNDSCGLEHGFTVKDRPAGAPSLNSQPSTLNLLLAVRGGLRPEVQADAWPQVDRTLAAPVSSLWQIEAE